MRDLEYLGVSWPEVADDLVTNTESITPCDDGSGQLRLCADSFQAYCVPGTDDMGEVIYVRGIRRRVRADDELPHTPVVGVEVPAPRRRQGGGNGKQWPTSWREVCKRLKEMPEVTVLRGRKHEVVYLNGIQVAAYSTSAHDHRAILNLCQQLKANGVDLRR